MTVLEATPSLLAPMMLSISASVNDSSLRWFLSPSWYAMIIFNFSMAVFSDSNVN